MQTDATLLDVTCCVRLHNLLHVVAQSLKPVKLFSQQLSTFLLFRDRRSVAQQCWIRLHSSPNIVGGHARSLRMVYKDLWVASFPRCTAGPTIVGSCCIRLHTTANTHATTPNILGATMLGVVASVCTQFKRIWKKSQMEGKGCWVRGALTVTKYDIGARNASFTAYTIDSCHRLMNKLPVI